MKELSAILPNGKIISKNSSCPYSFAVAAHWPQGQWYPARFTRSHKLAMQYAAQLKKHGAAETAILPLCSFPFSKSERMA